MMKRFNTNYIQIDQIVAGQLNSSVSRDIPICRLLQDVTDTIDILGFFFISPDIPSASEKQAEEEEDPEDVIAHVEDPEILVEETDDACDPRGISVGDF